MGPLCRESVWSCLPLGDHMRAWPSYEPVASAEPLWFQSSVVTSFDLTSPRLCCSTAGSALAPLARRDGPSGTLQMRAVESPEPEASSASWGSTRR